MANIINRQQTFSTNGTVTAAGLHNLIDTALVNSAIIKNQQEITTIGTADLLLIAPDSVDSSLAPRKVTVQNLFDDGLTAGTFTSLNLTGDLTYGTATGNRTVSTTATISTGTINNATLGTTIGTAATITNLTAGTTTSTAANVTNGTIQTLTASTATITGGTYSGAINSTLGTIATFNSTTGTIGNLSTTLAGDFTISQGTGTLATSGVTLGTYGDATSYPIISVDAKGRLTTVSTAVAGSSVGTNSVYFDALSTSTTESTNVSRRVAKGWVNFDGVNDVIRSSFNVASVTHSTQGVYVINFNTTIGTGMGFSASGNRNDTYGYIIASDVSSSTSLRIQASDNTAVRQNINYVSATVFGL